MSARIAPGGESSPRTAGMARSDSPPNTGTVSSLPLYSGDVTEIRALD
jgi:hypothetical protein